LNTEKSRILFNKKHTALQNYLFVICLKGSYSCSGSAAASYSDFAAGSGSAAASYSDFAAGSGSAADSDFHCSAGFCSDSG
jgi:hypothetical protein